jgi:hypothetical protein
MQRIAIWQSFENLEGGMDSSFLDDPNAPTKPPPGSLERVLKGASQKRRRRLLWKLCLLVIALVAVLIIRL